MDMYHDAIPLPEPLRETNVVGVAMRQYDAPNVIKRVAELRQLLLKLTPMAGQTSVDDGEPGGVLNQVTVDDIGANAVQTACEPHRVISSFRPITVDQAQH
jgi:hypothetical protein